MKHQHTASVIALALCLGLSGCEQAPIADPSASGIDYVPHAPIVTLFQTSAPTYEPGAPVQIQLVNRSRRFINYDLCRASIEWGGADGNDWRVVAPMVGQQCGATYTRLEPGRSAQYAFRFDAPQRRGSYRVRARLQDPLSGGVIEAISNTFTIRRDD